MATDWRALLPRSPFSRTKKPSTVRPRFPLHRDPSARPGSASATHVSPRVRDCQRDGTRRRGLAARATVDHHRRSHGHHWRQGTRGHGRRPSSLAYQHAQRVPRSARPGLCPPRRSFIRGMFAMWPALDAPGRLRSIVPFGTALAVPCGHATPTVGLSEPALWSKQPEALPCRRCRRSRPPRRINPFDDPSVMA